METGRKLLVDTKYRSINVTPELHWRRSCIFHNVPLSLNFTLKIYHLYVRFYSILHKFVLGSLVSYPFTRGRGTFIRNAGTWEGLGIGASWSESLWVSLCPSTWEVSVPGTEG